MSDQHELVEGEGRPDTSSDGRKEDGLAIFKELEREAPAADDGTGDNHAPQAPQTLRTVVEGQCGMGVDEHARKALEDAELRAVRASPYNLR